MAISEVQADKRTLRVPFPASIAINVGDLLWWDNVNKVGNTAINRPDQGSLLANQEDFAPIFLGVSADMRLVGETATTGTFPTGPGDRTVVAEGEFDCSCGSQTWEFGDLVAIDRNSSTPANYAQQVNKVTGQPNAPAIGYVIKREPVATTKVRCFLSAYQFGFFKTEQGALDEDLGNLAFPRNLIDGGDFTTNPWQRGTTFSAIANTLTYTADRWFAVGGASSSISVSQQAQTDVLGTAYSLRWGRANTNTAAIYLGQVLESADCIRLQGQPVTLSFTAKAGAQFSGANLKVQVNHSTTAGNDTAAHLVAASTNWQATPTIINTTIVPTTSAVRYTITGIVPTTATQLGLLFSYTPTGTNDTTDTIDFYNIQLEPGPVATQFEHRDVEMELAFCQRYCYVLGGTTGIIGSGAATSSTAAGFYIPFPTQMYAAPTAITITTAADISVYTYANASVAAISAAAFGSASVNSVHVTVTSSGMTSAVPYVLYVATAKVGNLVISCDF